MKPFAVAFLLAALIPARDLLVDADVLRDSYAALHPGLYRYSTPAQIDAKVQALDTSLQSDGSLPSAFLAIARFTASIRCGHSYPNPFNQPDSVVAALFAGRAHVPFLFRWIGGRMIVTANQSGDPAVAPGTEVVAINGTRGSDILAGLLPYARADGSNDTKRVDQMSVRGVGRYEPFDIYFPLVFPNAASAAMTLELRAPDGARRTRTVRAIIGDRPTVRSADAWTVSYPNPTTAYLRMPTWAVYDSNPQWKRELEGDLSEIAARHPERMIVDLRGNEGGLEDVGNVILAHVAASPLQPTAYRRLVRYRAVSPSIRPYLKTWDPSFYDWGASAMPFDDRFFELHASGEDTTARIEPAQPRIDGKLIVLVDGANSSATFAFDDVVQRNHLGTLVGTPTGGNRRGIDGGAFFFVQLPHSHIEVDLPLIGTFPLDDQPDAGLVPDLDIETAPRDIARGADPVFQAALRQH